MMQLPIVSTLVCELSTYTIIGNPIYPAFNLYDIREECYTQSICYPEDGLKFYVGGRKWKKMVNNTKNGTW